MMTINLLPPARIAARRTRRRLRRWSMAVSAYGSLVGAAVVLLRAAPDAAPIPTGPAQARLQAAGGQLLSMATEAEALTARLRISAAYAARIDWSTLLDALSSLTADDTFVERLLLGSLSGKAGDSRLVLELDALAVDQAAQSRFILAVESLRIFERVQLVETRRRALPTHEAFAFRLRCPLKEKF